jgi:mono/diheme cytochrome c family protein
MTKVTVFWAVLFVLSGSSSVFAAGNEGAGKAVYMKHCATCHAADGNGKEAVAKMMKTTIPPLSSPEVQALSDDEIRKGITDGKNKMKPVKDMSAGDITNVIAFVRSFAKK